MLRAQKYHEKTYCRIQTELWLVLKKKIMTGNTQIFKTILELNSFFLVRVRVPNSSGELLLKCQYAKMNLLDYS